MRRVGVAMITDGNWRFYVGWLTDVYEIVKEPHTPDKSKFICRGKFVCLKRGRFYVDCGRVPFDSFPASAVRPYGLSIWIMRKFEMRHPPKKDLPLIPPGGKKNETD